jgi:hypothetical protein
VKVGFEGHHITSSFFEPEAHVMLLVDETTTNAIDELFHGDESIFISIHNIEDHISQLDLVGRCNRFDHIFEGFQIELSEFMDIEFFE